MENNFKYKKIIILGGSGSGKSTLANRIGLHTGYPVYYMDKMLLDINWKKKDRSEWEEICNEFMLKDIGVVDGNYSSILSERVKWADLIIYIDISSWIKIYRYLRRNIRASLGLDKHYGIPDGAREVFSFSYILWLYNWDRDIKTKIFSVLESNNNKEILIINEPRKLDIEKLFK